LGGVRGIGKSDVDKSRQVENLRTKLRCLKEEFEGDIRMRREGSEGLV
jgi:hypothetical protein